jgi:glyoxylase-like metal-dependent hydrolase (beta-lactamase superfamily II)
MTARLDVLTVGYGDERVASTVVAIRDGAFVAVVDPGMVASRSRILDPLRDLGIAPEEVTDVVFSHHHPDHTLNAALFAEATCGRTGSSPVTPASCHRRCGCC